MTPIFIRSLTKRFGRTVAVDTVDLDVPAGSLFFLLGPGAAGETRPTGHGPVSARVMATHSSPRL